MADEMQPEKTNGRYDLPSGDTLSRVIGPGDTHGHTAHLERPGQTTGAQLHGSGSERLPVLFAI